MLHRRGARMNPEPHQMALMMGPQGRVTPEVNTDIQRIHFSPNPYGWPRAIIQTPYQSQRWVYPPGKMYNIPVISRKLMRALVRCHFSWVIEDRWIQTTFAYNDHRDWSNQCCWSSCRFTYRNLVTTSPSSSSTSSQTDEERLLQPCFRLFTGTTNQ